MKVGITGTPGTGKTSVSKELDRDVIDLKRFAERESLGVQRTEFEVDLHALKNALPEEYWIEGHLSHELPLDYCIVLRTRPDVLRERLKRREYGRRKIDENVEAESMDLILSEASHLKVFEIDTTGKEPVEVAERVEEAFRNREERMGVVDWSNYL